MSPYFPLHFLYHIPSFYIFVQKKAVELFFNSLFVYSFFCLSISKIT